MIFKRTWCSKGIWYLPKLLIQIILLVAGALIIYLFLRDFWHPHKQIAMANAEMLRSAINQVCITGSPVELELKFPQPTPYEFRWLSIPKVNQLLPRLLLKITGDPHYVIYYEAFPVGEAVKWERLLTMEERYVVWAPDNVDNQTLQNVVNAAANVVGDKPFVIGNIILDDLDESNASAPGAAGSWKDNYYTFKNYVGLSELNKTMIKYRACGNNSICLKTHYGVWAFPLKCNADVVITYKENKADLPQLSFINNFYLASPCWLKVNISRENCNCSKELKYSLFALNKTNGRLYKVGEHTECLSYVSVEGPQPANGIERTCIVIKDITFEDIMYEDDMFEHRGFCYTYPDVDIPYQIHPRKTMTTYQRRVGYYGTWHMIKLATMPVATVAIETAWPIWSQTW